MYSFPISQANICLCFAWLSRERAARAVEEREKLANQEEERKRQAALAAERERRQQAEYKRKMEEMARKKREEDMKRKGTCRFRVKSKTSL